MNKPKSTDEEIAREAWRKMRDAGITHAFSYEQDFIPFILAAIKKAKVRA